MNSSPKQIVDAIAANLRTDVTLAQGAPAAFQHVYTGWRKSLHHEMQPVAVLELGFGPQDDVRYTEATRRDVTYHARITVLWHQKEAVDTTTDNVAEADNFQLLVWYVKKSLRLHTSLGGLVRKCAEDRVQVRTHWEPTTIGGLHTAEIDFTVSDRDNAVPTG